MDKTVEAYSSVCEKTPKLCPRLVPSPIWGLSLAQLARMESRIASVMSDNYPALVEKISEYWLSLNRKGRCEVCGGAGSEIDEEWLYFVLDEKGKPVSIDTVKGKIGNFEGLGYLSGLRLLCPRCHLAKHQGYASTKGREREALEQFRKVNRLGSLEEARKLVNQTFSIHSLLSDIKKWRIQIGRLEELGEEIQESVQKLLNHMYSSGFRVQGGWLNYTSPKETRAKQEAFTVLAEVRKKAGEGHYGDKVWITHLLETMKDRLEVGGVSVSEREFILFVRLLLDELKGAGLFEQSFVENSVGKWIVRVPNDTYEKIFRRTMEALEESELAYRAKILCENLNKNLLPIIVYSPTSFAPRYISAVANVLKNVLNEFQLTGEMYYKPDIFTHKDVYSKRGQRASIYSYTYWDKVRADNGKLHKLL